MNLLRGLTTAQLFTKITVAQQSRNTRKSFEVRPGLILGCQQHKENVNKLAIQALPAELKAFYQKHEKEIVSKAMEPDEAKRKTGAEDIYHFIDIDQFGDPKQYPRSIDEGIKNDTLFDLLAEFIVKHLVVDLLDSVDRVVGREPYSRTELVLIDLNVRYLLVLL